MPENEMWERITKFLDKEIGWYFKPKNVEIGPLAECLKELLEAPIDEKYSLGGLYSNISNALEKFCDENAGKKDLQAHFNVLKNVEPFLKKIIFYVDREKFEEIQKEKSTLIPIINFLKQNPDKIFFEDKVLDEYSKNDYNYHLTKTYILRNKESHDAEKWSLNELSENIQSVLIFYLEVINRFHDVLKDKIFISQFDFSDYIDSVISRFEKQISRFVATDSKEDLHLFESSVVEERFSVYDDKDDFDDEEDDEDEDEVTERFGTVDQIRKEKLPEKRMLLWGDAGMGKSTTLQYLTYLDAKNYKEGNSDIIPVYIPLGSLIDSDKSLESCIFDKLNIPIDKGRKFLEKGKINLFLDGVNEIPEENNSGILAKRIKEIQLLLDKYSGKSLMIVSNRPERINQFTEVPVFRLQLMNMAKITEFLNKNTKNQEIRDLITTKIKQNQRLLNLIRTPLMATRLISIVREIKKVPESEGAIIKEFLSLLYKRERVEKKDTNFDEEKIDWLLTDLAEYGFNKNKTNSAISRKDAIACFAGTMDKYHFDYDSAYALNILLKLGVLSSDNDGESVVFAHQAYQDYYLSKSGIFPAVEEKEELPAEKIEDEEPQPIVDAPDDMETFYKKYAQDPKYEKSIMYRLHNAENKEERNKEIKILAEYNVLLAAKAIASGEKDQEIEDYVTAKAAQVFEKLETSDPTDIANAFLVSIELEKDDMLKYFLEILSKFPTLELEEEKKKRFDQIDRQINQEIEQILAKLPLELQQKWKTSTKKQRHKIIDAKVRAIREKRRRNVKKQFGDRERQYNQKTSSSINKISNKCNENQILKFFAMMADINVSSTILIYFIKSIPENMKLFWTSENKSLLEKIVKYVNNKIQSVNILISFYIKFSVPKSFVKKDVLDHAKNYWAKQNCRIFISIYEPDFVASKSNQPKPNQPKPVVPAPKAPETAEAKLLFKAAIYREFRCLAFKKQNKLELFRDRLKLCTEIGFTFEYLNKWQISDQDINNVKELDSILQKCIAKKDLNSKKYQAFFAGANVYFQELKPYSDAYYEVNVQNIKLNSLGYYLLPNSAAAEAKQKAETKREKAAKTKPEKSVTTTKKTTSNVQSTKFKDFINFSADSTELNIYIDEAWPCCHKSDNPDDEKTGVIAGIVWLGDEINEDVLQKIPTHIKSVDTRLQYFEKLSVCPQARPFIFPLKSENLMNSGQYFAIWKAAIKILLGWILPQNGQKCSVRIYSEHISGFDDGKDLTDHVRGLLEEAGETSGRFSRFNIKKVEWQAKDFEYIPYGDLLGYMAMPVERGVDFRERSEGTELQGYLPISLNLFELLSRLDIIEETKNVDDIYDLIDSIYGTKIYSFIMSDLKNRLENNTELKTEILESIEAKYLDKNRDLRKLRRYFRELMPFIESLEETADTVTKLMFTSIRLQDANHEGNPEKIRAYLEDYDEKRKRAVEQKKWEYLADCELNLAVHYNDEFLFDKALETIRRNEPNYDKFDISTEGKFYSSLGQNFSINKNFEDAEKYFCKALDLFGESEDTNKLKEIDQTTVYRMFNLLEWKNPEYPQKFREFFGEPADVAAKFAKENSTADQYRHHLFIRSVFECGELEDYKQAYLDESKNWEFWPQHPWQLIEFYRAMLLDDEAESYKHLENALEICDFEEHGGIIALMGAVLAAAGIAKCLSKKEELERKSLEFIEKAGSVAGAGKISEDLRRKLNEDCDMKNIIEILPFNYR